MKVIRELFYVIGSMTSSISISLSSPTTMEQQNDSSNYTNHCKNEPAFLYSFGEFYSIGCPLAVHPQSKHGLLHTSTSAIFLNL